MISFNSIKNFILTNLILIFYSFFQFKLIGNYILYNFVVYFIKNIFLVNLINFGLRHKKNISENIPKEEYFGEFYINIASASFVEALTYHFIQNSLLNINNSILFDLFIFIPFSFVFEVIFDFFHYWTHRISHHRLFYKYFHKKHHKFQHPSAITTFYQDPVDLIISNSFPIYATLYIMPQMSLLQYNLINIYKTYIEISGHSNKFLFPTSSFPQCMWIPRLLDIELYIMDHDNHHSINNCNYSKRFTLWDKVFGTYRKM